MPNFTKSVEMMDKSTMWMARPIIDYIGSLGHRRDSYEDILIENLPGLKDHLLEKGFLKKEATLESALESQERISREDSSRETSEEVSS